MAEVYAPALGPAHLSQRGTVRISGTLASDAVVRTGTGGGAYIDLRVSGVTPHAQPLRALRSVGSGPGAQFVADRMARYLKRGTRVVLYGTGLAVEPQGLLLQGCDHIEHTPPVAYHERDDAPSAHEAAA